MLTHHLVREYILECAESDQRKASASIEAVSDAQMVVSACLNVTETFLIDLPPALASGCSSTKRQEMFLSTGT